MYRLKLKAGALQLTLCIVVVIAFLLMAFMLFIHTHNRFSTQNDFIIEGIKNSNKGIDYALLNDLKLNDTIRIELKNDEFKSLKVNREFWGLYERVTSVSKIKNNVIKKTGIIGGVQKETNRIALYLQDNNQPLVVVGDTEIKGLSYLPKKGVKSGSVSGHNYYGNQLIYGDIKTSSYLPSLHSNVTNQIRNLSSQYLSGNLEQFLDILSGNTYQNSFFEPVQFVFSNNEIKLSSIHLIGNIIIQSKTKIIIQNSSALKDVILIAPEIEIQDGTSGHFQAFASQNIVVGTDVILDYPTTLVLNEKDSPIHQTNDSGIKKSKVLLKSGSRIKGSIIYLGEPRSNNYESQIEIEQNATVFGEVYCNQNIDLKGTVIGSVYTNNFISKQSGSIFQNHIYNGTISINELPKEFVGIQLLNSKKGIAKWLY
ncbi:hypothetical protein [Psychroserpens sp.]|uniref:hypothetical protein n=1 Tax=Psychroserpens sp. TaxID=2020870 RepID=UPI002B26D15A|nr:hypothetical protein [Psychroserpens sp.]